MRLFRIQDLPDNLRHQAEAQLAPRQKRREAGEAPKPTPSAPAPPTTQALSQVFVPYAPSEITAPPTRTARSSKMTATERRYQRDVLLGNGRFEAITLVLPGGSRYTPDWLTIEDGIITLTEVKGSYRLGSQGRAHTAFHEAAAAFPFFRFVWAEEQKGGGFKRTTIQNIPLPTPPQKETQQNG